MEKYIEKIKLMEKDIKKQMEEQIEKEKVLFENKNLEIEKRLNQKSSVSIEKFKFFIVAEEEHQHYSVKNPEVFLEELEKSGREEHLALKKK